MFPSSKKQNHHTAIQLSHLDEKNRLKSFPMLWMFSERCESDGVPWSQFAASLCFLLEFSKFLLHLQRSVHAALATHSQLQHMFPSGNFHQLLNKWYSNFSSLESCIFCFQSIPKFRIILFSFFSFFALYHQSLQMHFIPGMKQPGIANPSCSKREDSW